MLLRMNAMATFSSAMLLTLRLMRGFATDLRPHDEGAILVPNFPRVKYDKSSRFFKEALKQLIDISIASQSSVNRCSVSDDILAIYIYIYISWFPKLQGSPVPSVSFAAQERLVFFVVVCPTTDSSS